MQINVFEFLMDWIALIGGGIVTGVVVVNAGLSFWWVLLLMLPGALAAQCIVALLWVGVAKLLDRRPPRSDG